jgi:hypothetical protein
MKGWMWNLAMNTGALFCFLGQCCRHSIFLFIFVTVPVADALVGIGTDILKIKSV